LKAQYKSNKGTANLGYRDDFTNT